MSKWTAIPINRLKPISCVRSIVQKAYFVFEGMSDRAQNGTNSIKSSQVSRKRTGLLAFRLSCFVLRHADTFFVCFFWCFGTETGIILGRDLTEKLAIFLPKIFTKIV